MTPPRDLADAQARLDQPTKTIRVEVAIDTDELRKWADWHAEHRHPGVAHALYRAAERYDDQASALDKVRDFARGQREMAAELRAINRPYDALPYDNTAAALERIIGGEQ